MDSAVLLQKIWSFHWKKEKLGTEIHLLKSANFMY